MNRVWRRTIGVGLLLTTACWGAGCSGTGEPSAKNGTTKSGSGRAADARTTGATADADREAPATTPSSDAATDADTPAAVDGAKPKIIDADQYAAELGKLQGKVVLVDFWATWCGPCKEQFPHSNSLAKQLGEKGLAVVSVSFDDPDNVDVVSKFLAENPGPMTHLLSTFGAGVESFDAFTIEGGALPYYKLYDRTGKLRYQFCGDPEGVTGVIKIEELDGKIDELLNEKTE